ncbi:MarR family winged helix-turn-helix transcriptional regulator [Pedobacter miscanthi]|uniref:MarR family transcriptional regulator n=1 Tax=Pedobacter miscanthi TaxID=2259170 RepID=A0A366LDY2_9SPHI|nr:MarR family transcriptional regulator [Pedobacter miscanthi]RBQ12088.1 MarR family transcriptional regulator [Pedobacter miscanthi]
MKAKQPVIDKIRKFNRYYTKLLGLMDNHLLESKYSLAEARILYEIQAMGKISASQIISAIDIDKGYLSKVLKHFEKTGLISKELSDTDGRVILLSLTDQGKIIYGELDRASNLQVDALISKFNDDEQKELTTHMHAIMEMLSLKDS